MTSRNAWHAGDFSQGLLPSTGAPGIVVPMVRAYGNVVAPCFVAALDCRRLLSNGVLPYL